MSCNKKIILASASPRRKEILSLLGLDFTVSVSDAEPEMERNASVEKFAALCAKTKALDVAKNNKNAVIIAADTVVCVDGVLLGKPHGDDDAKRMLRLLSGKTHSVITAVCVVGNGNLSEFFETSYVTFSKMDEEEISSYIATGEPADKAGAYAVQGKALKFIEGIKGDFYNIMGFPASRFYREYRELF